LAYSLDAAASVCDVFVFLRDNLSCFIRRA
jgi:hypothetical protein